MVRKEITLTAPHGMHMRPAGVISGVAGRYVSDITIETNGKSINAKSIMLIMAAGIKNGQSITVICSGSDEQAALDAVCTAIGEIED